MNKDEKKSPRLKPRTPKGVENREGQQVARVMELLESVRNIYESYGFQPLDTGILEYADAIGSFLPDLERPNEGVFALKDDAEWLALRYDLTAPLARYVAQNFETLSKPFRRYQSGYVFRNEKVGPGRTRQFLQMDADTVGSKSPAADAEMCMMMADIMEAVGFSRGGYRVRVSNRKILEGVMDGIGIEKSASRRGIIMRAIDKYERLKKKGVAALLGAGRKDESGDFTKGAGLSASEIDDLMGFIMMESQTRGDSFEKLAALAGESAVGREGIDEMKAMDGILQSLGYDEERIVFDPSIVRGLAYYTGAVFEATASSGKKVEGALASGGRYDNLLSRFRPEPVPATGMSMGVDRLLATLEEKDKNAQKQKPNLIVILAMEKERMGDYQALAQKLRQKNLRAEVYLGEGGMRQQLKYADKRSAAFAVIEGEEERQKNAITIKDMEKGRAASKNIADNKEWRESAAQQKTLPLKEGIQFLVQELSKKGEGA